MSSARRNLGCLLMFFVTTGLACDDTPSEPSLNYPNVAGNYQGWVQYGCEVPDQRYGPEVPLAIHLEQQHGQLTGRWTDGSTLIPTVHQLLGSIEEGVIRLSFQDDADIRIRCHFDDPPDLDRALLSGDGFYVGGSGRCLRFLAGRAVPPTPLDLPSAAQGQ